MEMLIRFSEFGMNGFSMYVLQKIGCGSLKWLAAVFICKIQFLEKNF